MDRTRRRFGRENNPGVYSEPWFDSDQFAQQCESFLACWAELIDEMAIRFPLDLIIPGTPDSRNWRSIGSLISNAAGDPTEITFQAEEGSTLVISKAEFTPVGAALVDDVHITSVLNRRNTSFEGIRPSAQVKNPGSPTHKGSIYMGRAILRGGATQDGRVDEITYKVVNNSGAGQEFRYDIQGWIL